MGVVQAQIETVEEIYRLVWAAVANEQPIEATYQERHRLFCPHKLAGIGKDGFASSAINTEVKARADSSQQVPRQTGVVLCWRNSAR